jgi:N utilization substance protein A
VIVPDDQLSLAIGKRGQNARLAAKLTGLRVDIKSEGEVEEERRRAEEELAEGREALARFPGAGPQLIDKLVEAGLFSPGRIVRAGLAALEQVPGVGEKKAAVLLEAAQAWVAEQSAAQAALDKAEEERAALGEEGEEPASSGEAAQPDAERAPAE